MDKAKILKRLGLSPEAFSFRANAVTLPTGGVASTTEDALARINASPYVKRELAETDVYIHTIEAGSNQFVADRHCFLGESTLRNTVAAAAEGFAFMTKHAVASYNTPGENPYGRTFAAHLEQKDGRTRVLLQFYMLRDHRPNGANAASTDDLDKGLVGGTLFDVSLNYKSGARLDCDICRKPLFGSDCPHVPGTKHSMTDEQVAAQTARGIPGGLATYTMNDGWPKEVSAVYDGAIPNAGTAFSEQDLLAAIAEEAAADLAASAGAPAEPTEPQPLSSAPAEEENAMWTKEMKGKFGLAETATDAECEAAFAALQSRASAATTLEATVKANADTAFAEKYKATLGDALFATVKDLPNRDVVAQSLAEKIGSTTPEEKKPPIGDPLKGAGLATADDPSQQTAPTDLMEASEYVREGLGTFASNAEVEKFALTKPLDALRRTLGLKSHGHADQNLTKYDQMAIRGRSTAYAIAAK